MRLLLCLLLLLAGFGASWSAPGSILEGSRRVRAGFWSIRAPIFRGFCARARLQCPHAPTVTKPQFYWIGTQFYWVARHFASNAHHARNREKSLQQPFERGCLRQSRSKYVLELAGLVFGEVWEPSGPVLGASWALLGSFWTLLGVSWAPFRRLLGSLGRIWALMARSGLDLEGFREVPGRVLEPPGTYFSRFWRASDADSIALGAIKH